METKYPTLKRPKRKLCYITNNESPAKQWSGTLTLADIDRAFEDLDPSSHHNGGLSPPSPLLQTFDAETNQSETEASPVPQKGHLMESLPRCQTVSKGDEVHPATRSPSPKLDIELEIPFKAHMPVKTSSPIEENMVVVELDNEKGRVVSPLLFACEDEGKEEAKKEPLLVQNPQCLQLVLEDDDSELESPPCKVVITKPKMPAHQNNVEGSCKESNPVKEKTPKKPQTPVLEGKRKPARNVNTVPPVSAVQQPKLAAPKKISENVQRQPSAESTCVGKDMTAFLKKLRDAGQPKPACSRKSLSPVKVPTPPPEPEDDFLILEDDGPLWFSIPSKTATSKKQRQSRTSSSDKDSSTDKGTKDSPLETPPNQQEPEQTKSTVGSQTVNQKTKKMRGKTKKNEVADPGNDKDELPSPEDPPAGDLVEEEKPNKKKRLKKVPSKESDKEEEQLKDGASEETHEENPTLKTEKKAQKSSDVKTSKSLKDGNENAKKSRAKSLKGGRKVTQGSDAVKDTVCVEAGTGQSQSAEENADAEDLVSLSEKEILHSEAQTEKDLADEKDKDDKLPVVSEEGSSEDSQILGKRKRRRPGQWWLDHQITEKTKVADNQPTVKRSKQYSQEPSTAAPSPVKAKKDRVLKKRNQPSPSSSQNRTKAKEKKTKQNQNRTTKRNTRPDEVFEAEQFEEEEQQVVADQGLDVQSSPLVLSHRDYSHNPGEQLFQRVYRHVSNKKLSVTPAPASPRGVREQLRAAEPERRRRKPPGNWWAVDDEHQDAESVSSQPQKQAAKPRKKLSKQSRSPRPGTPKNGNMAVSSKPQGGAPASLLKPKPLSAPKTVKRSMATFKDIFTSVAETPTVVSRREAAEGSRREVTACPAEEVAATNWTILGKTDGDVLGVDAVEPSNSHETPQDSKCQSEDRLKVLRSGPSSMIELEQYEEDDSLIVTHPRDHVALSVSDLCAPPLKPLVLQEKDKTNLTEWLKSLWSMPVDKGAEITPDQFDWYFYQGRAIGFLEDLNCGSFCNGKILLGSNTKKPLWVDHSGTTVFNLLTSSVSVIINGKESRFNPGQSFMVPCGHAYSLQNVTAQPAVMYFTRMLAESSD